MPDSLIHGTCIHESVISQIRIRDNFTKTNESHMNEAWYLHGELNHCLRILFEIAAHLFEVFVGLAPGPPGMTQFKPSDLMYIHAYAYIHTCRL